MIPGKKSRVAYFCAHCGAEHAKWQGQCRECSQWNSLVEEKVVTRRRRDEGIATTEKKLISDIDVGSQSGQRTGIAEFDRVLGGQLLPGMTVLLGGEPGIGKSTLLLQAAEAYSKQNLSVLYVTGEESLAQLKLRSSRLKVSGDRITAMNTTSVDEVMSVLAAEKYDVVLVDSIQTMAASDLDSPPGTVAQVRESSHRLITNAKATGYGLFLVGHVTKDGLVAGPKLLEHMVDTVAYFEGDSSHLYRMLRAVKNRFGSVSEIGLFEMQPEGLVEVSNPSSLFLSNVRGDPRPGSVVTVVCEGSRPILVEIQALVTPASYGTPQRVAGGIDNKRLALLLAILEKRCGYPLGANDVFVSVAGGLRLSEPALDLPLMIAIASSLLNRPVDSLTAVVGEVGLSGEVRGVTMIDRRINEAARLGFTSMVMPEVNSRKPGTQSIKLLGVADIQTALDSALG
jgi:DNA repair protein RadA/Sms